MGGTRSLRCPACGRWLADVSDYARVVCQRCSAEITYKSQAERQRPAAMLPIARKEG
jgi:DNA-directed RNA polymerase subunit RPC12/RpoP